jgi:hypothetical protein
VNPIFLDAAYLIALILPRDALHTRAVAIGHDFAHRELVTSENVLVEVLAHMSRLGTHGREAATLLVDLLRESVMVIPQTHELFEDGLGLYRSRLDGQ